jgi:hypothetical protein
VNANPAKFARLDAAYVLDVVERDSQRGDVGSEVELPCRNVAINKFAVARH